MLNRTNPIRISVLFLLCTAFALSSCIRDICTDQEFTYARYSPVYMSQAAFESAVEVQAAQDIVNPGKIYYQDSYMLVNEIGKGVHIIDNKNPENPENISFLRVPGNYEIHIHCGKLYVDSSTDLLIFDMNDPAQPLLLSRVRNVLPILASFRGYNADPNAGVVVEWTREVVTESYDCQRGVPALWQDNEVDPADFSTLVQSNGRGINPASTGKAGSMSRFTAIDDYLYAVSWNELRVYDASNCNNPQLVGSQELFLNQGGADMITAQENILFVGASDGVYIYQTEIDPANPQMMGVYQHMTGCDPIAVQGNYGYVTLRNGDGSPCGDGFSNQLDVIDLTNIQNPFLIASFPMNNPHGVSIEGEVLFIADGADGLKVFDAKDPQRVGSQKLAHLTDMFGYDVIADNGTLIMVGKEGIAQYDYTDPGNIKLLSTIPVVQ